MLFQASAVGPPVEAKQETVEAPAEVQEQSSQAGTLGRPESLIACSCPLLQNKYVDMCYLAFGVQLYICSPVCRVSKASDECQSRSC